MLVFSSFYSTVSPANRRVFMASKVRGPYKKYRFDPTLRVPRQTRYNWRRAEVAVQEAEVAVQEAEVAVATEQNTVPDCSSAHDGQEANEPRWEDLEERGAALSNEPCLDESPDTEDPESVEDESDTESETVELQQEQLELSCDMNGAQISEETGVMLLSSLLTRHKLTNAALSDIISLLRLHLPANCTPKSYKSTYHFMKKVTSMKNNFCGSTVVHKLCGKCLSKLTTENCQDPLCQEVECSVSNITFLELPLDVQIRGFFEGTM